VGGDLGEQLEQQISQCDRDILDWEALMAQADIALKNLRDEKIIFQTALRTYQERPMKLTSPAALRFRGLSILQGCQRVLAEEGVPMRAKEITQRLLEGGIRLRSRFPYISIFNTLKNSALFVKTGKGVFALAEGKNELEDSAEMAEDPQPTFQEILGVDHE